MKKRCYLCDKKLDRWVIERTAVQPSGVTITFNLCQTCDFKIKKMFPNSGGTSK